jgi:hypothetical protein
LAFFFSFAIVSVRSGGHPERQLLPTSNRTRLRGRSPDGEEGTDSGMSSSIVASPPKELLQVKMRQPVPDGRAGRKNVTFESGLKVADSGDFHFSFVPTSCKLPGFMAVELVELIEFIYCRFITFSF